MTEKNGDSAIFSFSFKIVIIHFIADGGWYVKINEG